VLVDWQPSAADVGVHLRARTKDTNGRELGTFTQDTRPTGEQVDEQIDTAMAEVDSEIGDIPEVLQPRTRRVVALGAACLVELSFYPEQINSGRSPYPQLKAWYDAAFKSLKQAKLTLDENGEVAGGTEVRPVYGFPPDDVLTGFNVRH